MDKRQCKKNDAPQLTGFGQASCGIKRSLNERLKQVARNIHGIFQAKMPEKSHEYCAIGCATCPVNP
jgi:hypothetical protein